MEESLDASLHAEEANGNRHPLAKSPEETFDPTSEDHATSTIFVDEDKVDQNEVIEASLLDVRVEMLEDEGETELHEELEGLDIHEPAKEEDDVEASSTKEPIRSISSYFADGGGVNLVEDDEEESRLEHPRGASDFDFLVHASISPEEDSASSPPVDSGRLKSVSCVLQQQQQQQQQQNSASSLTSTTSQQQSETKDRQSSMSNFFEMDSADDTMDAMVAPPDQFCGDGGVEAETSSSSKSFFDNLILPEEVRSRTTSQSSATIQFDSLTTPPIRSDSLTTPQIMPSSDSPFFSLDNNNHEAWIPSERTRLCLVNINVAPPGSFYPDADQVTMPGVLLEESLGDPIGDLVDRFQGPEEAGKRRAMMTAANRVSATAGVDCGWSTESGDEGALQRLISSECFRSAIDLTGILLTNHGQGPGKLRQPSRHTESTLQIWLTRVSLLVKQRMFTAAEAELEAFGNFDRADLYYSYYPRDSYPGKWGGTLVPFSLRLIWAELSAHVGKPQESLDRLFYLSSIVGQILFNLEAGSAPDGSPTKLSTESKMEGVKIWTARRLRVKYAIANVLCQIKDYESGLKIFEEIAVEEKDEERRKSVLSGVGRLLLQLGDVKGAQDYFDRSAKVGGGDGDNDHRSKIDALMNEAYLSIGKGQFQTACSTFQEIISIDPNNAIARNNVAVCLIYLGRLREALTVLESLVRGNPRTSLQDGVVFNLATLYELESSKAIEKKKEILSLVAANKGDGFNPQCLKMI